MTTSRRSVAAAPCARAVGCKSFAVLALVSAVTGAGCASQSQFLDSKQAMAVQTAVSRGQFEMNCPEATGTVISKEVIQPALVGPYVDGIQRAEFTVGVAGCGKRTTFVVLCPDGGSGCYAAGPGAFHNW